MKDSYGRTIDYLRVSVTDRCNLRCVYCMPEEGVKPIPHERILRFHEITRLVRILAEDGLKKVKLTGGEPLVRMGHCGSYGGASGCAGNRVGDHHHQRRAA